MQKPLVSIIITTKNEGDVIENLFESIKKQTYPRIETLVIDNKSTDNTLEVAKKYTKNVFTKGPERSAQRNYGASFAKGNYFLFADADMVLSPNVVAEAVGKAEKTDFAALIIPETSDGRRFWERVKAFERSFYCLKWGKDYEAARFFTRRIFLKFNGYDERITGPEDWDLPRRIEKKGGKIGRISSIIYHRERIPSLFSLAKKKYYYALNSHTFLKKQQISVFGPDTIYFFRPVFYRHWRRLLGHPVLFAGMIVMFLVELGAGGVGYFLGRKQDKN